jgi:predicted GIY-YIG superfamily endonuclease
MHPVAIYRLVRRYYLPGNLLPSSLSPYALSCPVWHLFFLVCTLIIFSLSSCFYYCAAVCLGGCQALKRARAAPAQSARATRLRTKPLVCSCLATTNATMTPLVYLLSNADGSKAYFGFTTNGVFYRLSQHNGDVAGGARPTRLGRPWRVVLWVKGFSSKMHALAFENVCQKPSTPPGNMFTERKMKGLLGFRRMFAAARALRLRRGSAGAVQYAVHVLQSVISLRRRPALRYKPPPCWGARACSAACLSARRIFTRALRAAPRAPL